MSFATDRNSLLTDKNWRRRNSRWLLWVILGFGIFSFVGFVILAVRMKTRRMWTIALATSAVTVLVFTIAVATEDPKTQQVSDFSTAVTMIAWLGMIAAGVYLNREHLRWRAAGGVAKAWYHEPFLPAGATTSSPAPAPIPTASQATVLGINESDYFAAPAPAAARAPAVVDINAASMAQLQAQLGVDPQVVHRIIGAREAKGGFRDLDDLVSKAGLQPHELVRVRGRVTFGPIQGWEAPRTPPDQAQGRILDF